MIQIIQIPISIKRLDASYHTGIDYLHRLHSCRSPSKHYRLLKVRFPGERTREDATDTP